MQNLKKPSPDIDILHPPSGLTIYHRGPGFNEGPLPSIIYFALSGIDSLSLDPYNQPIEFLSDAQIRSFSFSLPFHGKGEDNVKAMSAWAGELKHNPHFLNNFLDLCLANIDFLMKENLIITDRIATSGLSRGCFIAVHLGALSPHIKTILGFAPLIDPSNLEEFKELPPKTLEAISLSKVSDRLVHKKLRLYVGNRDIRVNTESCFQFIKNLTELSYHSGVRSPQTELILFPSIGHKGHGTPPKIFKEGVNWIQETI